MRQFTSGATIVIEPWRAAAFPIVKDLMVNRAAFDRIIEAGGYITVSTGAAPEANLTPVPKDVVANTFGFAEKLLASQKAFAEKIVAASAPVVAASTPKK